MAENPRKFRAADVVKHAPSGEEWVLMCDEENGSVFPAGWPSSIGKASDCTLVEAASDNARLDMLRRVAAVRYGNRSRVATYQLSTLPVDAQEGT
jgi:hypothetical protein